MDIEERNVNDIENAAVPVARDAAGETRHPMGVVTQRTGLSGDVIRAWERRYGVVQPTRSAGGHRLYSDSDVERLRILHRLTIGGRQIGQIAGLSDSDLAELLREDEAAEATAPRRDRSAPEGAEDLLEQATLHVRELDAEGLDATLRRAVLTLSTTAFLDDVLGPLLGRIGDAWMVGTLTPAHEHLATAVSRRIGGWLMDSFRPASDAPCVVVCTPTGQGHDLGALAAAVTAAADGWKVRYLGADLPARDIDIAVRQTGASVLALSIVHPESDPSTHRELEELGQLLSGAVAVVAGGSAAASYQQALDTARAIRLDSFEELQAFLRRAAAA